MSNALTKTNNIEEIIQRTESISSLRIEWIKSTLDLNDGKNKSIISLYKEAFSEPPYEEKFTDEEVYETLADIIKTGGLLFVARPTNSKENPDNIIAFTASVPLKNSPEVSNVISDYVETEKSSYFAEDAVDKSYRRKGISQSMKSLLLSANWEQGYNSMVLRTSALNIKQISAVTKSGALPLSGVFQDVIHTRQDNTTKTDRRGFYMFTPESSDWNGTKLERVTIVRPGGNETAFVWDQIPREKQGEVSKLIQAQSPIIEQVMFIEESDDGSLYGQMAGGEFCGNATRSFGYLLLDGKDGEIDVNVSGATSKMHVEVKNGEAKTQIPVKPDLSSVQLLNDQDDYIVNLDGISFLITSAESTNGKSVMDSMDNTGNRDECVKKLLKEVGIIDEPASGIMVTYKKEGKLHCEPFVFVRDIDTLYYESGCGSGSTSLGMVEAFKSKESLDSYEIVQPSGLPLIVTINRNDEAFIDAYVDGPIEILEDTSIVLPSNTYQQNNVVGFNNQ